MKTWIASLLLVTASFAQTTQTRPAQTYDDLKTYLALTDAQTSSLTVARQAALTQAQPYMDQIREKQQSLRGLTDESAIAKIMAEINTLQEKVKTIMEALRVASVGTLTSAQQAKLKTLQDAAALRDEIQQAGSLGLLTAPDGTGGFGPRGFGGPRR